MRLIAWLLTIGCALGGLALRVQGGVPASCEVGTALLLLAGLACPLLWAKGTGMVAALGLRGKDRVMLSLALILAMPLLVPWPV